MIDAFISTLYNEDITLQEPDLVVGMLYDKVAYNQILDQQLPKISSCKPFDYAQELITSYKILNRHTKIYVGVPIYK